LTGKMGIEMRTENLPEPWRRLAHRAAARLATIGAPEWAVVMGTALVVGLASGLGAVVFRWLIGRAQWLFFGVGGQVFAFVGDYYIVIIPALGGLIVGPLIFFFAREAKGHGVPEVMEAVALKGGRIRPRVAVVKSLASSVCIGSGGSIGREGPIVQIGSALGSTLGQMLHLSEERVRSLVACGAAGGISATFNAPIAGAVFALEIIQGEFQAGYFGAVVISAVVADVVANPFEGAVRAFPVPPYTLVGSGELPLYALLGVLAALVGVLYSKLIYLSEDVFDAWKHFPEYLKPMAGGLLLGLLGVLCLHVGLSVEGVDRPFPQIFGVGYETIETTLLGQMAFATALALLVLKLLATALTLGSGGSGGVFAPGLFIGSMLGAAFGQGAHALFGNTVGPIGAYALVGMGAVFAGATHAPATAILILFEMTGDYNLILPLMFAVVISVLIARAIEPESIYTTKLTRRGIRLQHGRDVDLMHAVKVEEVMTRDMDTVPAHLSLAGLLAEFERTHHHGLPVLEENGALLGVVTLQDLEHAMQGRGWDTRLVAEITTSQDLLVAYPDESVGTALRRLGARDVGRLPVVARDDPKHLLGVVRRQDIVRAYNAAVLVRADRQQRAAQPHLQTPRSRLQFVECTLLPDSPAVGKPIRSVNLPRECVLVSVRRGNARLIPHGDTVLQAGDYVTAYLSEADRDCLLERLRGTSSSGGR
jgi:CIC family chloride channel protein